MVRRMKRLPLVAVLLVSAVAAADPAQDFLRAYQSIFLGLNRISQDAQWTASTDVSDEHEGERTGANSALAAFQGDRWVVESCKKLLAARKKLPALVARQLDKIVLAAAEGPGTIPDETKARVAEESRQAAVMDAYTFKIDGKPVSANDIDDVLHKSRDLNARKKAWDASKEIGFVLRDGLQSLVKLRNRVAREMGFSSYFALQVADYDMSEDEMMKLLDSFVADTKPMFDKLHALAREKLAARYKQPAPQGAIPAHWIDNRWAQEWSGLVEGGVDLDPRFKDKTASFIVKTAEKFWVSLGFEPLPPIFWEKSDLYPIKATDKRKKNNHATAWHMDLDRDVRSLMSVKPDSYWFFTAHHELGHIYYYLSYSRPDVPPILRQGANRAMHEAMGELAGLAARQPVYLKAIGVLAPDAKLDERAVLLDEALDSGLPLLAWAAGTMPHFERDLYSKELPQSEWQKRWWENVAKFQGVVPPSERPQNGCDACSKYHIIQNPAQYYNYAIATVIKYQLHDHICKKILKSDPHQCNYFGHKEVGDFLRSIMKLGATKPWREVIQQATGEPLSTRAMLDYFKGI